jgi:hypothetical protein
MPNQEISTVSSHRPELEEKRRAGLMSDSVEFEVLLSWDARTEVIDPKALAQLWQGANKLQFEVWAVDSSHTTSFHGPQPATFASVPCAITSDATFVFGLETDENTFGLPEAPEAHPIIDRSGLLTFDSDDVTVAG